MGQYRIDTATKVSVNRQRMTQSQITIFDPVQIWSAQLKTHKLIILQFVGKSRTGLADNLNIN